MTVKVLNLLTNEEHYYSHFDPIKAVKASYALTNNLGTQWATTLGELELTIMEGRKTVSCGDWCARK